MIVTSSDLMLQ